MFSELCHSGCEMKTAVTMAGHVVQSGSHSGSQDAERKP